MEVGGKEVQIYHSPTDVSADADASRAPGTAALAGARVNSMQIRKQKRRSL